MSNITRLPPFPAKQGIRQSRKVGLLRTCVKERILAPDDAIPVLLVEESHMNVGPLRRQRP